MLSVGWMLVLCSCFGVMYVIVLSMKLGDVICEVFSV